MSTRSRRRRVSRLQIMGVGVLAVIAAVLVLLGVFRISSLQVSGTDRYTPDRIRNDLIYDFWTENTLFFTWKYKTETTDARAPYLSSIQAKLESPGSVLLTVTEKHLVGAVELDGQFVCFDEDGIILEIDEEKPEDVPLIEGLSINEPALYQKLTVDNTAQLSAVLSTARLLQGVDMQPDSISLDENLNIRAAFGEIDVELGMNELLEEKVAYLSSIYPSVKGEPGVLHMETYTGNNETFTFSPKKESKKSSTAAEGEGAAGAEGVSGEEMDPEGSQGAAQENGAEESAAPQTVAGPVFQAFDAYGNLHNDAQVVNGQVVDAYGTPLDGITINDDGSVTDGYWNVIYDVVPAGTSSSGSSDAGTGDAAGAQGAAEGSAEQAQSQAQEQQPEEASQETVGLSAFMVFDSSGTLRYDAHVVGGQVVDAYGNPIPGCSLDENGNVVDAYWNVIDPHTGTLAQ